MSQISAGFRIIESRPGRLDAWFFCHADSVVGAHIGEVREAHRRARVDGDPGLGCISMRLIGRAAVLQHGLPDETVIYEFLADAEYEVRS